MIAGGHARLLVADVERAVRFYVETMGFKVHAQGGARWAEVDAGGGFVLCLEIAGGGVGAPGGTGGTTIELEVNQPIAEVIEVLANRGVSFEGGVRRGERGNVATLRDIDGNELRLLERGHAS